MQTRLFDFPNLFPDKPQPRQITAHLGKGVRRDGSTLGCAQVAETVGNELDQLLEHVQSMKMGLIEAVEFFAVLTLGSVFTVSKAEEVSRHRSDLFGSRWKPIYRTGL